MISILLVSGCKTIPTTVPSQISYEPSDKVGLVSFSAEFAGKASDSKELSTMSPLVSAIAYETEGEDGGSEYEKELIDRTFETLNTELEKNNLVSFIKTSDANSLIQNRSTPPVLAKYAQGNNLDYLLSTTVRYSVSPGFTKPLSLIVSWSIYDHFGNKVGQVETVADTKIGYGVFPNPSDQNFREPYLSLVGPAVEQFFYYLKHGDIPKDPEITVYNLTDN